ncbi:hypothetical protein DPEC_G00350860 [Dallia pectoralis]|uniref:Uncharacterized protein n=1 Tax=Dallia pectoralis TaxID=75939 RepID=A0ACC2F1V8_DALPE|nr:hypothetical protein DPEC_G00350860 [Dallia pectoralis]
MRPEMEISPAHRNLMLMVYTITFLIGFPANMVAFFSLIQKMRRRATPNDVLLFSLTTSDLIFLFVLPCKIKEASDLMKWNLPYFLCTLTNSIFYATIYNSTLFLTAISVDRYLGVAFPIMYKLKRRPLYAMVASILIWVITMAHISIVVIVQFNAPQMELDSCFQNFTQEHMQILMPLRLEIFLVLFCVPFFICCFCYINFVWILSQRPNINPKKRLRAIGLSLGTLLVFTVCFAPYNLSHLVGFIQWESPSWRLDALLSSAINATLDPIIFYFSSSALRGTFKHLLRSLVERVLGLCGCFKALYSRTTQQAPMTTFQQD